MKILKIAVLSGSVLSGLFSCAHPNANEINNTEVITIKDSSDLMKKDSLSKMERAYDLLDYIDHNAEIDARYSQNVENLNGMKKSFKSEVNADQLKYEQGLYELNKTNLKIKTKVNDHIIQDTESWGNFKISTNNEMNSLEKSIRVLVE